VKYELIIIRYGEISLKREETRRRFESTLVNNIKNALDAKQIPNTVKKERGRIYVYTSKIEESIPILTNVFGIVSVSPAIQTKTDINSISKLSLDISKNLLNETKSFAVRATRTGKHDFTSQDIAVKIGSDVVKATKARVNLTKPDFEIFIEIRNDKTYLFTEKIRGVGGLPLGTQGKVISLIIDKKSLLAAWYLMHRGCKAIFIKTKKTKEKIEPFFSKWNIKPEIITIKTQDKDLYKNLNQLALEYNCDALVTNYNIDKNSLDLLSEIKSLKQHMDIPVLHPLIAMDEKTINKKCKDIGLKS